MGKHSPSLVTKWLSGTHNFTVDTLIELEHVLEIDLFHLDPIASIESKVKRNVSH